MQEALTRAPKFREWHKTLEENGLTIHGIEEVYSRIWHQDEVLFSLVLLDATTPEGDKIPPVCFIKGQVVCVMVILVDEVTRDKYNLLVKQRRICNGGYVYEQVAGLVDGEDRPLDVAVREVAEETGIHIATDQLVALNQEPLYPSTGTSDEAMWFFYCELPMSYAQIMTYDGNKTGLDSEHERIYTRVTTIPEAKQLITNTNGLLNMYLYEAAIANQPG